MIWQRYITKEICKVFALFLFAFFFVYVAIDYSTHMQDFIQDNKIQVGHLLVYYGHHFVKRSDLLIPLALLIATIKVLSSLNHNHELLALQTAGIKLKTLFKPFFLFAAACSLFLLASAEFVLPYSLNFIDQFHDNHFKHSTKGRRKEPIHALHLKDNSKLIYQSFDPSREALIDVLWVCSADEIWRIKYLRADPLLPIGQYVDHLKRGSDGLLEKVASFDSYHFKQLHFDSTLPKRGMIPIENRSASNLWQLAFQKKATTDYQKPEILTYLSYKAIIPFLPFLVIIASAPFCTSYSRNRPLFAIYALGLFGFIAFYTLMDACLILGANHTLPPFWVIFTPFAFCLGGFAWNFAQVK